MSVSPEDIRAATERVRRIAHRTPVLTSRTFDRESRAKAFFKCENFQRGGSFKVRGASNFIYSLPGEQLKKGVVAYSSGNHAQAVAIAAASVGAKATLVMPKDAPRSKLAAARSYGAKIVTYDRQCESREEIGCRIAAETGAVLVPPYDHPWTIAGQGTAALELLEEAPDLDALAICVGGGGLISGCALAAQSFDRRIRVFGVEPDLANDTWLSLQEGRRVEIPIPGTIADGLRATSPGEITFPIIQRHVEQVVLVGEQEIREAVKFLVSRLKILVEPSGAVAAAAALFRKLPRGVRNVGVMISGGNVDLETLAAL